MRNEEIPAHADAGDNKQTTLRIGGLEIQPGQRLTIDLPVARLYTRSELNMPVHVIHGKKPGPRLFVSAAIHGDEIIGVAIIRRLLKLKILKRLHGTLIAIPVVNVYGFINQARYLPDRRDLNRCFPGSERGSLASRLADLFMDEIVSNCTHGIDIHSGSNHRKNLPQIRACLEDPATERLAHVFGAPVILDANLRDGSLRQAVMERKIPMLLYEAGEILRFDEMAIRTGINGILSVMRAIDMLPKTSGKGAATQPLVARSNTWIRAPISGILRTNVPLGGQISQGAKIGEIADPFGEDEANVLSPVSGIVIGRINIPLVHQGDALFHMACFDESARLDTDLAAFQEFQPGGL